MRELLNSIDNYVLVLDREGEIKFCNEKLLNKLEFDENEVSNNIARIIKREYTNIVDVIKKVKNHEKININLDLVSKNNKDVLLNADILIKEFENEQSIFVIAKDASEQHYTKEDLEMLLDNMPFTIWIKDKDGKYKYVNENFEKLGNISKSDVIGKNDNDMWGPRVGGYFLSTDKKILKTKTPQIFEDCVDLGDEKEWFETYKAPILDKNNNIEHIVGKTTNITFNKVLSEKSTNQNEKILQFQEILNNKYNKEQDTNLLNELGEVLYKYLEADTLIIHLLDEKNPQSKESLIFGEPFITLDKEEININDYKLEYLEQVVELQGTKSINEVKSLHLKKLMLKNNINSMGIYNIMFNGKLLGLIGVHYKDENKVKVIQDDYLKSICNQIGIYLKNKYLLEELSTELKKREEIEMDLQDFVDISVDIVAKFTIDGQMIKINNKWTKTLGWSKKELVKINILELIHPDDLEKSLTTMRNSEGISGSNISRLRCKDGSYKIFNWNYKIIRNKGFLIATARDITKKIEEEEQRQKLEEAIKLESFKNEFFSNLSHEFKTPLNIILGSIQLLNRNIELKKIEEDSIYTKYLKVIQQNSYRLLRLINNLIDITRLDSNFYELQLENCNIVNIVENITLSVAQYIEDNGISLTFDTNCEEKIIACDQDKIERILLNLLSNAIKYTSKDGEIFVNLKADGEKVIVSVRDNGIGIEKDKLESIFIRFKRADDVLTRRCEGSGIGLSLVKSLVELHQGNIYVKSELKKGSEFIFEIPVRTVESKEVNLLTDYNYANLQIEKCNIEFSDIYS